MITEEHIESIKRVNNVALKNTDLRMLCEPLKGVQVWYQPRWGLTPFRYALRLKRPGRPCSFIREWDVEVATYAQAIELLNDGESLLERLKSLDHLYQAEVRERRERNERIRKENQKEKEIHDAYIAYARKRMRTLPTYTSIEEALGGIRVTRFRVVASGKVIAFQEFATACLEYTGKRLKEADEKGDMPVGMVDGHMVVVTNELPLKTKVVKDIEDIYRLCPREHVSMRAIEVDTTRDRTEYTLCVPEECYVYDLKNETLCLLMEGAYTRLSEPHLNPEAQTASNYAHWYMHKGKD